jgi:hypothetical protein
MRQPARSRTIAVNNSPHDTSNLCPMRSSSAKPRQPLRLEKVRNRRVASKTHDMNSKHQTNVFSSHSNFKHTAKPASLESVLHAFGLKKSDLKETKQLVLAQGNKHRLAHVR